MLLFSYIMKFRGHLSCGWIWNLLEATIKKEKAKSNYWLVWNTHRLSVEIERYLMIVKLPDYWVRRSLYIIFFITYAVYTFIFLHICILIANINPMCLRTSGLHLYNLKSTLSNNTHHYMIVKTDATRLFKKYKL